jgi:hypothetical protein
MKSKNFLIAIFSIVLAFFVSSVSFAQEFKKEVLENSENLCVLIPNIASSTKDLEKRSFESKKRIKSLENTIDQESVKRETILSQLKNVLQLKKTDKQVIADMRKTLNKAKGYYLEIDTFVIDNQNFLEEYAECENLDDLDNQIILDKSKETENLLTEEEKYRKTLAQNLKEKLNLINKEIEKTNKTEEK